MKCHWFLLPKAQLCLGRMGLGERFLCRILINATAPNQRGNIFFYIYFIYIYKISKKLKA